MSPPADPIAEIKRLYFEATRSTIARDLDRAIALLKTLPTEDERERVAVYMDGLAQLRSEWQGPRASAPPTAAARPSRAARKRR
ncbi:MAG: hypothetical protein AB7O28_25335 [Vicinamibacterales bacterium]